MVVRLQQVLDCIDTIDRDLTELARLKTKMPLGHGFSQPLQMALEKQINHLLNQRIGLQELEIEMPSEEIRKEIFFSDHVSSSSILAERKPVDFTRATAWEEQLFSFLREMPKVEIHLHMEACIAKETLSCIMEKNNIPYDRQQMEKLYDFKNLQEFINLFLYILDAIKVADDFELIFKNLRKYLEENNILYAEVFLAPSRMIANNLNFNEIAEVLDHLSVACRQEGGPQVKYLIDVSRTFGPENAAKNLRRILNAKKDSIIGIGLGGAELMGPARDYAEVFAQAKAEGLHCVAHAGEDDGPWSIRDSVVLLGAERIGHATSAIQDPSLMDLMRTRQVPIEVCLTSNIFTGKYVRQEKDHPVRRYYDEGLICTVNTDDPEIFNVSLSEEYYKYYKYLNFNLSELIDLNCQGVYSTFHPNPHRLWKEFEAQITELKKRHGF